MKGTKAGKVKKSAMKTRHDAKTTYPGRETAHPNPFAGLAATSTKPNKEEHGHSHGHAHAHSHGHSHDHSHGHEHGKSKAALRREKTKKKKSAEESQKKIEADTSAAAQSKKEPAKSVFDFVPSPTLDSVAAGKAAFEWMIWPKTSEEFFKDYFEDTPLLCRRSNKYYGGFFGIDHVKTILEDFEVQYTRHLDVTKYKEGSRYTFDNNKDLPESAFICDDHGRQDEEVVEKVDVVDPSMVWKRFKDGCSLRLLHPQQFHDGLWYLVFALQEYLGAAVGVNIYVTPSEKQGFSPHYDDVDVFILQMEGQKRWRLYPSISEEETLARFSSRNFAQSEIGKPSLDVVLSPGDFLYVPRGCIHQAVTVGDTHSLHITVSSFQKTTWGDFMLKSVPQMVQTAMDENVEFRRSLPRLFHSYVGVMHQEVTHKKREAFETAFSTLFQSLIDYVSIDAVGDAMCVDFIRTAVPPPKGLHGRLKATDVEEEELEKAAAEVEEVSVKVDSYIRATAKNIARIVPLGGDTVRLFHSAQNERVAMPMAEDETLDHLYVEHAEGVPARTTAVGEDERVSLKDENTGMVWLDLSVDEAEVVESLLLEYPTTMAVDELPLNTPSEQLAFANLLVKEGIAEVGKRPKKKEEH